MISIKDVAQRAQVSTATVSHVLNGTRFVAEETKNRVYAAMRALNYTPNSVARSLRSRKSNIIGLLVPMMPSDSSSFFFLSVAQGIESVLNKHGYNLFFSNSNEDLETEQEQLRVLNAQRIDGLIMAPTFEGHAYLAEILTGDYPVVFVDRKPDDYQADSILADGRRGTFEAVRALIARGHRRIGFVGGGLGLTTHDERLAGYREALAEGGIVSDEALIREARPDISNFDNGYTLAGELLDGQGVTAFFVANNVMTMGTLKCLQERGLDIPGKVALIGFDDYEWARVTSPPLTMVRQPSFELGRVAAETLLKRIEQPTLPYAEIRLNTEVIHRGSS